MAVKTCVKWEMYPIKAGNCIKHKVDTVLVQIHKCKKD